MGICNTKSPQETEDSLSSTVDEAKHQDPPPPNKSYPPTPHKHNLAVANAADETNYQPDKGVHIPNQPNNAAQHPHGTDTAAIPKASPNGVPAAQSQSTTQTVGATPTYTHGNPMPSSTANSTTVNTPATGAPFKPGGITISSAGSIPSNKTSPIGHVTGNRTPQPGDLTPIPKKDAGSRQGTLRNFTLRTLSERMGWSHGEGNMYPFIPDDHLIKNITKLYRVDKELGDGASCKVVKVTSKAEETRKYAMKEMRRDDKYNPMLFEQEIRILRKLQGHQNILQLHDSFVDRKNFYILTELCGGGELFDKVKKEKYFSEERAVRMVRVILDAILYCHERNIVHRDLKPENIVFRDKKQNLEDLVIIDFGDAEEIEEHSQHDNFIGSPFYIAPEALRTREGWELKKSDVWAIGVITYILLTGRPPFWAHENKQIIRKIIKADVRFPHSIPLGNSCKDFILNLLKKEPLDRFSALQALQHPWLNGHTGVDPHDMSHSDHSRRVSSKPHRSSHHNHRPQNHYLENEQILSDLATYATSSKMKRLIIKTVASNLDGSHRNQYRAQFKPFDLKEDGVIDKEELMTFFIKCKIPPDQAALRASALIHNIMGVNHDSITVEYWIYSQMGKLLSPQHICQRQFQHLDINGDNVISSDDIVKMFDGISKKQAKSIIKEVDNDMDGVINFEDFKRVMEFEPAYKVVFSDEAKDDT